MKLFNFIVVALAIFLFINCKDSAVKQNAPAKKENIEPTGSHTLTIQDLAWLQGSWINEDKTTIETWAIQGDSLAGNVYSAVAKRITEVASIKKVGDSWVFGARVLDQNEGKTIFFNLENYSEGNLLFTNPNHDFPNSLSYSKMNDKTLNIVIAGTNGRTSAFQIFKLD